MWSLSGLFLAAFLAATLIPAQSEVVLAALILAETHPLGLLVAAATLGNVLGALVNWGLGRWLIRYADNPRFPVGPARLAQAQAWYHRWGWPSLLVCWLPIIGDPLTLAAGAMREPFWRFLIVVTLAKLGRYLVLAALVAKAAI